MNKGVPNILSELPVRKDGGEGIIKDEIILGRNLASLEIKDHSNIGTMLSTIAQKYIATTLSIPLAEIISVLELWI